MCLYLTKYTSLVGVVTCVGEEQYDYHLSLNHCNTFLPLKMVAAIQKYTDVYVQSIRSIDNFEVVLTILIQVMYSLLKLETLLYTKTSSSWLKLPQKYKRSAIL